MNAPIGPLFAPEPLTRQRDLWPHQSAAIENLRAAIRAGKKRPMLMAPTGAGKTEIATRMTRSAIARGRRVLFVAPYSVLIDQTADVFRAAGIWDIGIIQAERLADPTAAVQIATVQTLVRRPKPNVDFGIYRRSSSAG